MKDGKYFKVYRPDHPQAQGKGYVREHRLVYEEYYNCCLLPWILIHHINGDTTDNRIENLEPMTKPNHQILHLTIDKSNRHCLLCPKTSSRKWYEYLDGFKCHSCYMKEYHKKRKG